MISTRTMHIVAQHLTHQYDDQRGLVFEDLTFDLAGCGLHALFGPSGAGKTTLARMLAGLLPPDAGQIEQTAVQRVLYTYNTERLPGWCNVETHLRHTAVDREVFFDLAESFGLTEHLTARFDQLSLGQQNRINLIRYLLQDFDLLIMDESLANVDEIMREQILVQLKKRFPQRMFLYISHNVLEVIRFCDQILVLRGPGRNPRMIRLQGCDSNQTGKLILADMEPVMLELLHAA